MECHPTGESRCELTVQACQDGYVVRVVGRGTRQQSPIARDFVRGAMQDGKNVIMDLSQCDYLDSTFLGCLAILAQHNGKLGRRFAVHGGDATCQRLFGSTHLERILPFTDSLGDVSGEVVRLPATTLEREQFCEHLLETHRELATLGGSQADAFMAIANHLQQDLDQLKQARKHQDD